MSEVLPEAAARHRAAGDRRDLADLAEARASSSTSARRSGRKQRDARRFRGHGPRPCSETIFDLDRPTIGVLNIGVEEMKGAGRGARGRKDASGTAPSPGSTITGFVEGDDLGRGTVDIVVTEGFTGNVALKTAEGTARQLRRISPSAAMSRTLFAGASATFFFARSASARLKDKMDPRKVNGGVFLGLNGIVIKSHGGTDAEGFASAIELARRHGARRYSCARSPPDTRTRSSRRPERPCKPRRRQRSGR